METSKGLVKQTSFGSSSGGQSEGSIAMPTRGTQLELNADTTTPTTGPPPRTSHPAVFLSVFLLMSQK